MKESLREIARSNIQKCQDACNRIDYAIRLLKESAEGDGKAFRAFQLANEAMLLQRRQTLLKSGKTFDPAKVCWYPFQLAFVLHELTSFMPKRLLLTLLGMAIILSIRISNRIAQ